VTPWNVSHGIKHDQASPPFSHMFLLQAAEAGRCHNPLLPAKLFDTVTRLAAQANTADVPAPPADGQPGTPVCQATVCTMSTY